MAAQAVTVANTPPTVDAGLDGSVNIFNGATYALSGSASDPDGGPSPLTFLWEQVDGPGTTVFGDATSLVTTAAPTTAGTITLRLTAFDGEDSTSDELILTVTSVAALDTLIQTPNAVYSFEDRVRSAYVTNRLFRIRNGTTNVETDIGWGANNRVDRAAIAIACPGANGFVVTVYDQSGNGRNLTMATTANQPKIYDSAAGVQLLGTVAIAPVFDTTDHLARTDCYGLSGFSGISVGVLHRTVTVLSAPSVDAHNTSGGRGWQYIHATTTSFQISLEGASRTFVCTDTSAPHGYLGAIAAGGARCDTLAAWQDGAALAVGSTVNGAVISNLATDYGRMGHTSVANCAMTAKIVWSGAVASGDRDLWFAYCASRVA